MTNPVSTSSTATKALTRNGQETRGKLVRAAYEQIHANGFQGMRVDQVLKQTQLQKGAFYHHFRSKTDLGYAVVEEEIKELMETVWLTPIAEMDDPVSDIPKMLESMSQRTTALMKEHGCPLNNLAQEMSKLDDGFRQRIDASFDLWISTLRKKMDQAKEKGYIRNDLDSNAVSRFIIAAIEGCISISKVEKSTEQFEACHSQLSAYLQGLQA